MKFVVVGLGSIGNRHKRNLERLKHQIIPCHRNDDLGKIVSQEKPDGVFICNPTALHLTTATKVAEAGVNIYLEKPISHNLKGVDEFLKLVKNKKIVLEIDYNLRLEPELRKIKQQLEKKSIGKVYAARIVASSYLPSWRPKINYQENYGAKKSLGGGVLLDLSHEIDYAVWFFGKAKKVMAMVKKAPELKIETEAIAKLLIEFESGAIVEIHLDYVGKKTIRNCQIIGSQGSLSWDFVEIIKTWDCNQMYIDMVKNFIETIEDKSQPIVTGEEAKQVVEIVEAAKKSSQTGKMVEL